MQSQEPELKALFLAGLAGDSVAYRQALQGLSRLLRAFLRQRLAPRVHDVEDVLQEALMALHVHRDTFDPGQALMPWAYTIARHKLIDFVRRRGLSERWMEPLSEEHEDTLGEECVAHEAQRDVQRLLSLLPDRHRIPIELTKLEGLSVAEAAQRSGLSEPAIKTGVHRGLKALAALMSKSTP